MWALDTRRVRGAASWMHCSLKDPPLPHWFGKLFFLAIQSRVTVGMKCWQPELVTSILHITSCTISAQTRLVFFSNHPLAVERSTLPSSAGITLPVICGVDKASKHTICQLQVNFDCGCFLWFWYHIILWHWWREEVTVYDLILSYFKFQVFDSKYLWL